MLLFTGQRIRLTQDSQNGQCIEVSQDKAIDELEEIKVERNMKEDLHSTLSMHTMYRSLLVQISRLQSRTQFQCCYTISRCLLGVAPPSSSFVTIAVSIPHCVVKSDRLSLDDDWFREDYYYEDKIA